MATKRLTPETESIPARRVRTVLAAQFCDVSPRTLEKWRVTGFGPPYIKQGAAVRYDLRALERWLASRERSSTSDPGPPPRQAA